MYYREELTALAASKAVLVERIRLRRDLCAAAAARAARPLKALDLAVARWRRLSPFVRLAAVPLGLLLARLLGRRARALGALLRWGPVVLRAVRGVAESRDPLRSGLGRARTGSA
jgi:hypothetical protein